MHYTRYEEEIVQRYGIVLQGWTYEDIMNPSLLSSSIPPLKALWEALVAGTCKFVKLTAAEKKEREVAYMAKIKSGDIEVRKRKRRSDAGTRKKKRSRSGVDADDDGNDGNDGPKSQETIDSDSDAAGDS